MNSLAIFCRALTSPSVESFNALVDSLLSHHFRLYVHVNVLAYLSPHQAQTLAGTFDSPESIPGVDAVMSVGGDGTFLEAMLYSLAHQIPIIGLNSGRLGFLSDLPLTEYENAIQNLKKNQFSIENRTLISVTNLQDFEHEINKPLALNEFAITKRDTSSMIVIHVQVNGEYLNSYWADGLIVSTPTGSTGYSLSCGGPILMPDCSNFIITPISPHNLNVRPLVVPDTAHIDLQVEGRAENILISLDSRFTTVPISKTFTVFKADQTCKILRCKPSTFTEALRKKLLWGKDLRN